MKKYSLKFMLMAGLALSIASLSILSLPFILRATYTTPIATLAPEEPATKQKVAHVKTPEPMKAIYMTACVAGTPSWRASLKELIQKTELNAVVIDIKDSTGTVSFKNESFEAAPGPGCVVRDLKDFIQELHDSDIYVIGRISVFQDPAYTKLHPELAVKSKSTGGVWKDRKGLSFVDVGAKQYWDYVLALSKSSYELGFDEINFDYVRYPSDGDMQDTDFTWTNGSSTKPEMLESFFSYLNKNLRDSGAVLSADLFGMTTTVTNDLNIGQVLERALPYFDYIYPMVYPSHYPKGWNNFSNPAEHPYEVIKIAMTSAIEREQALNISNGLATSTPSKIRPWLQDFDLGADYTAKEVQDQIRATYESGITSWLIWNAGNRYTEEALLTE